MSSRGWLSIRFEEFWFTIVLEVIHRVDSNTSSSSVQNMLLKLVHHKLREHKESKPKL